MAPDQKSDTQGSNCQQFLLPWDQERTLLRSLLIRRKSSDAVPITGQKIQRQGETLPFDVRDVCPLGEKEANVPAHAENNLPPI